jgi:hypothetical protein
VEALATQMTIPLGTGTLIRPGAHTFVATVTRYHVFIQRATDGQAPIEAIVPKARRMPLYRLINDPFSALQERGHVQQKGPMADFLLGKAAAA